MNVHLLFYKEQDESVDFLKGMRDCNYKSDFILALEKTLFGSQFILL